MYVGHSVDPQCQTVYPPNGKRTYLLHCTTIVNIYWQELFRFMAFLTFVSDDLITYYWSQCQNDSQLLHSATWLTGQIDCMHCLEKCISGMPLFSSFQIKCTSSLSDKLYDKINVFCITTLYHKVHNYILQPLYFKWPFLSFRMKCVLYQLLICLAVQILCPPSLHLITSSSEWIAHHDWCTPYASSLTT